MIIDFCHSFKDYDVILNFYGIWNYSCPKCLAKHCLHRHAKYSRYLLLWAEDGGLQGEQMELLRLKCSSCGSTHAILTMDMIPFCIYSVQAFLALVSLCMQEDRSVLKTEEQTGVSYQLLYHFLAVFHEYRQHLILFLRSCSFWEKANQPMARDILSFLWRHHPPWPQSAFFRTACSPLFLRRHSTVAYPLLFGSRFPDFASPT